MDKENLKPKRRRKSYRHFHDRRKNDVRKRQAKARETLSTLEPNAPISAITPKQPTITSPEQPALPSQKQPTITSPEQPALPSQKQPTITSPEQPALPSQKQPTITSQKQLTRPSQKQPTITSQKQLTRPSQKQPTITSPQQSTISTSILESATTQQMALTTAESCSQPDSTLLQQHHPAYYIIHGLIFRRIASRYLFTLRLTVRPNFDLCCIVRHNKHD